MGKVVVLLVFLLLTSCVGDTMVEPIFEYRCGQEDNVSVQSIRETIGQGSVYINEDLVVEVTVIANDYYNNFFKKVVVSDATGGFELLVGMYDAHLQFPIGRVLHISMKGLTVDTHNRVMRVGISENSLEHEAPGSFYYYYILDRYVCDCASFPEVEEPEAVTISGLRSSMCGQLVTVTGVVSDEVGVSWAMPGREIILFKDSIGNKIAVETSAYATFASEITPNIPIAITGVLSLQNIDEELFYTLKIRDLHDVSAI